MKTIDVRITYSVCVAKEEQKKHDGWGGGGWGLEGLFQ